MSNDKKLPSSTFNAILTDLIKYQHIHDLYCVPYSRIQKTDLLQSEQIVISSEDVQKKLSNIKKYDMPLE